MNPDLITHTISIQLKENLNHAIMESTNTLNLISSPSKEDYRQFGC